ncbi:MAG: hypothetical protein PHV68_00975 [Candidatus Gastranaerophilales bacterium]|nr:hypothetical protein [Candidatus Gastranaerophilales bacterium]
MHTLLAQKYGMPTCTIRTWVNHFLDNADSVFENKKRDKEVKAQIKFKEKQIEQLPQMVEGPGPPLCYNTIVEYG